MVKSSGLACPFRTVTEYGYYGCNFCCEPASQ